MNHVVDFSVEKSDFILEHFYRFNTSYAVSIVVEEISLSWPITLLLLQPLLVFPEVPTQTIIL